MILSWSSDSRTAARPLSPLRRGSSWPSGLLLPGRVASRSCRGLRRCGALADLSQFGADGVQVPLGPLGPAGRCAVRGQDGSSLSWCSPAHPPAVSWVSARGG